MNYFSVLRQFWQRRRIHPLKAPPADLYFAVAECMNAAFWRQDMAIPNSTLAGMTGRSTREIMRNRQALVDAGYIEYKSSPDGSAGHYRLTGVTCDGTEGKSADETGDKCGDKNVHIYKQDKTYKHKSINAHNTRSNNNRILHEPSYDIEEMQRAIGI